MPSNSLEVFLWSPKISERKAAYLDIIAAKGKYIEEIKEGLETFEKTKDRRFDALNRLIYLATIIRDETLISPLVMLLEDYDYLWEQCLYRCPIVFALEIYAAFMNWSPSAEWMANLSWNDMVIDLGLGIQTIEGWKNKPLEKRPVQIHFGDPEAQKKIREMELLSEEELIQKAGPENDDITERWYCVEILAQSVADDKNLAELYWLAIEEPFTDGSQQFRYALYWAIVRAEIARAQQGGQRLMNNHNFGQVTRRP